MQSHSSSEAVLNPSHCTMSSQHSGIEQWQNKLVSQVCFLLNLTVFGYRGKGSKTTSLQTLNIRQDASSYALTIRMFWIKNILWYALERKVSSTFTRTLRMVFSLSFVGGFKSAETQGRRIESFEVLPAIQRNPRLQVNFVSFQSFWPRCGKKYNSYWDVLNIRTL